MQRLGRLCPPHVEQLYTVPNVEGSEEMAVGYFDHNAEWLVRIG